MALLTQMGRLSLDQFHRFSYPHLHFHHYYHVLCEVLGPFSIAFWTRSTTSWHWEFTQRHLSIHLVLVFQNVPGVTKYQLLQTKYLKLSTWMMDHEIASLWPTNFAMSFFNGLVFWPSKFQGSTCLAWCWQVAQSFRVIPKSNVGTVIPDLLSWKIDTYFVWKRYSVLHEITDHSFTWRIERSFPWGAIIILNRRVL